MCAVLIASVGSVLGSISQAQQIGPRTGIVGQVDGFTAFQTDTDIDGGGTFSQTQTYVRGALLYRFSPDNSVGLALSYGHYDYEFSQAATQPWTDIRDLRVSVPMRLRLNQRATAFVVPSYRWIYQEGADSSDGATYGAVAGISWKINDQLSVGPLIGAFSQLEDNSPIIFPGLLIDWDINDKFNISTGSGIGATLGPGVTLRYRFAPDWNVSLTARGDRSRFRLDDAGLAAGGIGQDRSLPVLLGLAYEPSPLVRLNLFAGAKLDGELKQLDRSGVAVYRQDYDPAPVAGASFRLRF